MKICIANQLGRAQGPDHTDAIIADCFSKKGYEVIVATNSKIDIISHFKYNFDINIKKIRVYGILPSILGKYPVFGPFWVWLSIQHAVRKENPDILLFDGVAYRSFFKNPNVKTVVYFNEPISGKLARLHSVSGKIPFYAKLYSILYFKILQLLSTQKIDVLIANSKEGAKHYEKIFHKEVYVLPSPVDTSKFKSGFKENLVTHVGVFNPRKKIEVVIEAVAKAKTKPNLIIIGNVVPGLENYVVFLKKRVNELHMKDRVEFKFNASFEELREIIGGSKIFVSAGVEYFSLAVIEQMSAGCIPIVNKKYVPWRARARKKEFFNEL